jgi:hypothetical protein
MKLREKPNDKYSTVEEKRGKGKIGKVNESEASMEAALRRTSETRLKSWQQSLTRSIGVQGNPYG